MSTYYEQPQADHHHSVNPLYYVTFTTFTLLASFILFQGFNTTDTVNTISLLAGFLTIFAGVYLLNLSRDDPEGHKLGIRQGDEQGAYHEVDGIPTDGLAGISTRLSMQARRSSEMGRHSRTNSWNLSSPVEGRMRKGRASQDHLMYDIEANGDSRFGLGELAEDSDEDTSSGNKRTSFDEVNGSRQVSMPGASAQGPPRRSNTMEKERVRAGGKSFDGLR